MSMQPTQIDRDELNIWIAWSDGARLLYSPAQLRQACPCALCREKHGSSIQESKNVQISLPILTTQETHPLVIAAMLPVGNYAYNIHFSDGHNAGIFPFELLRSIGQELRTTASARKH